MGSSSSKSRYHEFRSHGPDHTKSEVLANERPKRDPAQRRHYIRQYRRWLWPYRAMLALVFGLALTSVVLNLLLPLATKYIIDDVLPDHALDAAIKGQKLFVVCAAMMALLVFTTGIDTWRTYLMSLLNAKVIFRLRQRLFDRFLRLPLAELSDLKSGGIVSRLSQDTDKVTGLVQMAVITPGVATIRVLLTVGVLIFLSWQMALVASLMIPPIVLVNLMWIRKVRPIYRTMAEERERIDARVTETFGGIRVVRAFRRERREERDYAVAHHTIIRKNLLAEKLQLVVSGGWGLLIPATTLSIVGVGGYLVIAGTGTIGDIVAFQMYAVMLLHPVSMIVNSFSATQQALAALERVFDILERKDEKPDVPGAVPAPYPINEIRFDKVAFEYRKDLPVLQEISLTVPAGSVVALVGPSGGGKTTFTDLVARFHDPTHGAILINGIDLRTVQLASFRSSLAVVGQETFLFDGTVRENIAYGRRHSDAESVLDAARRANAHEFIDRLPEKYETLIGERGVKLSGGQRQRISIARAILADPEILILDEATSNLDTESEQLIQASLAELLDQIRTQTEPRPLGSGPQDLQDRKSRIRGEGEAPAGPRNRPPSQGGPRAGATRTTFVIAHRLSTITHADMIVVLDRGRIVETGRHADLIAADGLYRDMVERQQRFASAGFETMEWG